MNVLQLGPESSGGKMIGSWLHAHGIDVYRLSFPYEAGKDRCWPSSRALAWMDDNPEGPILVTMRGTMFAARSQVAVPHVSSIDRALANINEAYMRIFSLLGEGGRGFYPVVYESVVHYPETAAAELSAYLGVPIDPPGILYDANQKWYHEGLSDSG